MRIILYFALFSYFTSEHFYYQLYPQWALIFFRRVPNTSWTKLLGYEGIVGMLLEHGAVVPDPPDESGET